MTLPVANNAQAVPKIWNASIWSIFPNTSLYCFGLAPLMSSKQPTFEQQLHSRGAVWEGGEVDHQGAVQCVQSQSQQRQYIIPQFWTIKTTKVYLMRLVSLLLFLAFAEQVWNKLGAGQNYLRAKTTYILKEFNYIPITRGYSTAGACSYEWCREACVLPLLVENISLLAQQSYRPWLNRLWIWTATLPSQKLVGREIWPRFQFPSWNEWSTFPVMQNRNETEVQSRVLWS